MFKTQLHEAKIYATYKHCFCPDLILAPHRNNKKKQHTTKPRPVTRAKAVSKVFSL